MASQSNQASQASNTRESDKVTLRLIEQLLSRLPDSKDALIGALSLLYHQNSVDAVLQHIEGIRQQNPQLASLDVPNMRQWIQWARNQGTVPPKYKNAVLQIRNKAARALQSFHVPASSAASLVNHSLASSLASASASSLASASASSSTHTDVFHFQNQHSNMKVKTFRTSQGIINHILEHLLAIQEPSRNAAIVQAGRHPELEAAVERCVPVTLTNHPSLVSLRQRNPSLDNLYRVAEYLRSYIDYHHDFVHHAQCIIGSTADEFERTIHGPRLLEWFQAWRRRIDAEILRGGGVNQLNCRAVLADLAEDVSLMARYKAYAGEDSSLYVDWIPRTRQEAFLQEWEIRNDKGEYDEKAIQSIRDTLRQHGVHAFYVESMMGSIGPRLHKNEKGVTQLANLFLKPAGYDAGSGYGSMTKDTFDKELHLSVPSMVLFGVVRITLPPDSSFLRITYLRALRANQYLSIRIPGPQILSVNALLLWCEMELLRGSKDEDRVIPLQGIVYEIVNEQDQPVGTLTREQVGDRLALLATILKTWTDLSQVVMLSEMPYHKPYVTPLTSLPHPLDGALAQTMSSSGGRLPSSAVAVIVSDACCEISFKLYGYPYVLFNEENRISLYCYDRTANRAHYERTIQAKKQVAAAVLSRYKEIHAYLLAWFEDKLNQSELHRLHALHPDVFFCMYTYASQLTRYRAKWEKEYQELEKFAGYPWKQGMNSATSEDIYQLHCADLATFVQGCPPSFSEWLTQHSYATVIAHEMEEAYRTLHATMNVSLYRSASSFFNAYEGMVQAIRNTGLMRQHLHDSGHPRDLTQSEVQTLAIATMAVSIMRQSSSPQAISNAKAILIDIQREAFSQYEAEYNAIGSELFYKGESYQFGYFQRTITNRTSTALQFLELLHLSYQPFTNAQLQRWKTTKGVNEIESVNAIVRKMMATLPELHDILYASSLLYVFLTFFDSPTKDRDLKDKKNPFVFHPMESLNEPTSRTPRKGALSSGWWSLYGSSAPSYGLDQVDAQNSFRSILNSSLKFVQTYYPSIVPPVSSACGLHRSMSEPIRTPGKDIRVGVDSRATPRDKQAKAALAFSPSPRINASSSSSAFSPPPVNVSSSNAMNHNASSSSSAFSPPPRVNASSNANKSKVSTRKRKQTNLNLPDDANNAARMVHTVTTIVPVVAPGPAPPLPKRATKAQKLVHKVVTDTPDRIFQNQRFIEQHLREHSNQTNSGSIKQPRFNKGGRLRRRTRRIHR